MKACSGGVAAGLTDCGLEQPLVIFGGNIGLLSSDNKKKSSKLTKNLFFIVY